MTIKEAVHLAFEAYDTKAAGAVSDALRARGLTYKESFEVVQQIRPTATLAEWDALLREADEGS